jgi:hypothetical protein
MRALFIIFALVLLPISGKAQQLVILYSETSIDVDGKEFSAELAELVSSKIAIPTRIEHFPIARVPEALSQPNTSRCSIVARFVLDNLNLIEIREIARMKLVLATLDPVSASVLPTTGSLNAYIYRHTALMNGINLHIVPSLSSAVSMFRLGRLTQFLAADSVIETLTRAYGVTFGEPRELETVSLWLACSRSSFPEHQAALSTAWEHLLSTGQLQALFARHYGEGSLLKN